MNREENPLQNLTPQESASSPSEAGKEKPTFSLTETVCAWLCLLLGYFFCRIFPVWTSPLGGFLFVLSLFLLSAVLLSARKIKPSASAVAAGVSALAVSLSLFLGASPVIWIFAFLYALAAYLYFISASFGNGLEGLISSLLPVDFCRAVFITPFLSFGGLFTAIGSGGGRSKKGWKTLGLAVLGIALAVIPTVIVASLLGYDRGFSDIMERIFDFDLSELGSHIFSAVFGIPVGMYIFGSYLSAREKKQNSGAMTAEEYRKRTDRLRAVPAITGIFAVIPVLFVYGVFFVSQWKYYVSGFSGVLPEGVSYAGYAREGFFELCAVSFINLLIISALSIFMKRRENGASPILTVITAVFSVCSLILIATAGAKMVMYVNVYGLTPLRVYSSWFMCLLAILFLLIPVCRILGGRWAKKILPLSLIVTVVMFTVIAVSGVNSFIADYNVDRYIDGTLDDVDVVFLESLGDDGVPAMCRLVKHMDGIYGTDCSLAEPGESGYNYGAPESKYKAVVNYLYAFAYRAQKRSFFETTVAALRADAALRDAGIEWRGTWKSTEP